MSDSEPIHDLTKAAYVHRVDGAQFVANPDVFSEQCDAWIELAERGRFRAVVEAFTRLAPAEPNTWPSSAWRYAGCYNLALALERAGRFDEARAYMERSEMDACLDAEPLLYPSMVLVSQQLREHQERALARRPPPPTVLIAALPRSASGFVSTTISTLLDVPIVRVSVGDCVIERWVRQVMRGGAVTHNHFPATGGNVETLARAGVRKVFVQVRDPRQSIWSLHHMMVDFYRLHREHSSKTIARETPRGELDWEVQAFNTRTSVWPTHHLYQRALEATAAPGDVRAFWEQAYRSHVDWIEGWRRAHDESQGVDIEFIFYDDVNRLPAEVIAHVLSGSGVATGPDVVSAHLAAQPKPTNFYRGGGPEDWRQMPKASQELLWSLTPEPLRAFLKMGT